MRETEGRSQIDFSVIRKEEQSRSEWSGGTTTQLAIYPADSDYKLRTFKWRISTARVDSDESTFTPLPGIHRYLMILDGNIKLIHEGRRELEMKPFAKDEFEGDWITKSIGRCTDFNLMTKQGEFCGALDVISPDKANCIPIFEHASQSPGAWEAIYCLVPELDITIESDGTKSDISLRNGDFLLLHRPQTASGHVSLSVRGVFSSVPAVRAAVWRAAGR